MQKKTIPLKRVKVAPTQKRIEDITEKAKAKMPVAPPVKPMPPINPIPVKKPIPKKGK